MSTTCKSCSYPLKPALTLHSVPPEVRTNYIAIIDSILAVSNLEEISEKKIRRGIADSVQYDITPQKVN
jgi:DEK C terminal domain